MQEILVGILHLHNKLLAFLVLTIDIEYGLALCINIAHILAIEILHVLYHLLTIEEGVKEVDKQLFIWVCAEDSLKAEIGQQTDISFF